MKHESLKDEYFEWMCALISSPGCPNINRYCRLLNYLNSKEFIYILEMDGNRYADGIDLRYRFGHEMGYTSNNIALYLDDHKCTIFEMMVALSNRFEEETMSDPDYGDRTGLWFWTMVRSLGLDYMDDRNFNKTVADRIISGFINREYGRDGRGGLFTVPNCEHDLREVDIWYQMVYYLNTIIT